MTLYRVLHISDTHFCEIPNRKSAAKLFQDPPSLSLIKQGKKIAAGMLPSSFDMDIARGLAAFIYEIGDNIDLILHSGDLATTGRIADLDVALSFLEAKPDRNFTSNGRPTIAKYAEKIFICPGNHDRYKNNFAAPWCANFNLKFSKFWKQPVHDIDFYCLPLDQPALCFVSIDFCLRRSSDAEPPVLQNRYGRGKAYSDILARLDALMIDLRLKFDRAKFVWVIHFPPHGNCSSSEKLIDHEMVLVLADRHKVSLITSGHLHHSAISRSSFGTPIISAASACSADESPHCSIHLIDIKIDNDQITSIRCTDYNFNEDDGEFDMSDNTADIVA